MNRSIPAVLSCAVACLLLSMTSARAAVPDQSADLQRCREHADIDACYDAIRWSPTDPQLLAALGDAFAHANRSADALRIYKRAASLAPGDRGITEKLTDMQTRLSAKRSAGGTHTETAKRYSNSAPESQSH
ncbi:MAG TPA: hypothetical protein VHW71_07190 [Steroidobacteraceae bacterium]|jgi:Flp pilus assembly protein TadD|nr:hypothetical protein [Steroidobacteraceae bacterium]